MNINQLGGPVPGISLVNDPNDPKPFEKPPRFVKVEDAQLFLFDQVMDEAVIPDILKFMNMGVPLSAIAQMILFAGFASGKWNPDLMLLLVEPLMYILIFLAEQSGVDFVLGEEQGELNAIGKLNINQSKVDGVLSQMFGEDKLTEAVAQVASQAEAETASAMPPAQPEAQEMPQ